MPGKSSSRWRAITDSSGTNTSSPIGTKRGSTSFGTFTRANVSVPETGSRSQDAERERQVRDVRERPPGPDGERREHREDLLGEQPVDRLELARRRSPRMSTTRMPCSASAGRTSSLPLRASGAVRARARARRSARSSRARRQPVRPARVDAGVDLVVQAGHAHHVELVQVGGVDREELDALEQRQRSSSASSSTRSLNWSQDSSRFE